MPRIVKCVRCGEDRNFFAREMCKDCYYASKRKSSVPKRKPRPVGVCTVCSRERTIKVLGTGECGGCYEKRLKSTNVDYHARQKANTRKHYRENKDHWLKQLRDRTNDPILRVRDKRTKFLTHLRNLGITEQIYLEHRDRGCAICKSSANLHIDHDHGTGLFRGILCSRCNNGLGFLGDNISGIEKALAYLRERCSS